MATASRVGIVRPRWTSSAVARSPTSTIAFAPICRATSRIAITWVLAIRHAEENADLTHFHVPPIARQRLHYEHGLTWRVGHLPVYGVKRGVGEAQLMTPTITARASGAYRMAVPSWARADLGSFDTTS